MGLLKRIFCKHDWNFSLPGPDVSSPDWTGAKFGCTCRKCSAMDFRELPKAALIADLNTIELMTFHRLKQLTRNGYKTIDVTVRKDGNIYHFEGNWLAGSRNHN